MSDQSGTAKNRPDAVNLFWRPTQSSVEYGAGRLLSRVNPSIPALARLTRTPGATVQDRTRRSPLGLLGRSLSQRRGGRRISSNRSRHARRSNTARAACPLARAGKIDRNAAEALGVRRQLERPAGVVRGRVRDQQEGLAVPLRPVGDPTRSTSTCGMVGSGRRVKLRHHHCHRSTTWQYRSAHPR
jgi:hypothetical protein